MSATSPAHDNIAARKALVEGSKASAAGYRSESGCVARESLIVRTKSGGVDSVQRFASDMAEALDLILDQQFAPFEFEYFQVVR
jgi:hypothetical protein